MARVGRHEVRLAHLSRPPAPIAARTSRPYAGWACSDSSYNRKHQALADTCRYVTVAIEDTHT